MIDGFTNPAAWAAAALAIPILLAYMLRPRRPRVVVPSTFLWREATRNVAASRPWQRLRPSVLLLLQLLVLLALVVALAQPFRTASGVAGDHLVLIVDLSGSMRATDEDPDRLGAARREALDLLETLPSDGIASVVAAGPRPRVVVSSTPDRRAVRRAVESLEASEGAADFVEAFLLAESLETPGHPATIVLASDGGLTQEEKRLIPPGTIYRPVGTQVANVGITGLDVGEGPGGFEAFVTLRNSGGSEKDVELFLDLDGRPVASATLPLPAAGTVERSFELGVEEGRVHARIDGEDALEADDRAYAVLERTRPRRVLLFTEDNLFLEALLAQLPGADLEVTPEPVDPTGADLVVYDRVAPPAEIGVPALFVAPTQPPARVKVLGEVDGPAITYLDQTDPLLESVDLSEVAIARAQAVEIEGGKTLVGADDTPLIATWSDGTLRRAWFGFDLHESNLPLQVAFPVLGDHLLGWLTGAEREPTRFAGDPIGLAPPPATTAVRVTTPDGKAVALSPEESFTDTDVAGFYEVSFFSGDRLLAEHTRALSLPPRESDLAPGSIAAGDGGGRPGLTASARRSALGGIGALALLLLLLEWWWAHGRPLPRLQPRGET
jgi:Ca-activated chloride channel family protein